jgi:hypothetical protein
MPPQLFVLTGCIYTLRSEIRLRVLKNENISLGKRSCASELSLPLLGLPVCVKSQPQFLPRKIEPTKIQIHICSELSTAGPSPRIIVLIKEKQAHFSSC